jgi:lactate permease
VATIMLISMNFILPIVMLGRMTRFFGPNRSWKNGFAACKICFLPPSHFAFYFD